MKRFKILNLLAVTAATTMAFAASASADYVTTTTGGSPETPTFHAVNEGGHVTITNPLANISCASTIQGDVEEHVATEPVSGQFTTPMPFTGCTNSWHVTTVEPGLIAIQWDSGHNGKLYSTGTRIDATRFGITCEYETNNTYIGTLTGGNPATLHLEASIPINISTSSGLCGTADAEWKGSYVTTSALYVGNS